MSEDSTRPKRRQVGYRAESALIIPFPKRRPAAEVAESDHITITLMADGTHNVRLVGQYAEAFELASEALHLVLDRVAPAVVLRAGQVISFPARRFA